MSFKEILKLAFLFLSYPLFGQQLGFALEQINAQAIIDERLTGRGIKIGIIDGGFLRANENASLNHFFENNLIAGYKDYLQPDSELYSGSAGFDDGHGTEVWELIGGLNKEKGVQLGLATGATYYLARTDHGGYEKRKEEEFAIEAMEWMAKEGVKIINLSLGYNFGYTDKRENYEPHQIDGKSTILTQAIDRLSNSYKILFIVAAGNDGNKKWRILGSPGDAASALTVGATKLKVWDEMNYSSEGPEWLNYVKPEVSCYSTLGTSFSAPVISGLAACLLERYPSLTGEELKTLIIRSCQLHYPNNYIGYGVPDSRKALQLMDHGIEKDRSIATEKNSIIVLLDKPSIYMTVYHKQGWKVLRKETIRSDKTKIKIKHRSGAERSTVIWESGNLEIIWK